ncbi:hypothetical protein SAMN05444678_11424 [Sphingomonas sp. YR710]|nr:hypothetical protein [Sphingomonas sp. YR710]SDD48621.1 hypothetical protein SAMN05444678_11424 [Sphingomonas sp. YR710]
MFDSHPSFQIDGNFGGTAGITEMLVLNRGELVDLLPALPAAWPNGSITGVRLRGGAEIDMIWRDGKLYSLQLRSVVGGSWILRHQQKEWRVTLSPISIYRF